jgi:phage regulator Rha-like protein
MASDPKAHESPGVPAERLERLIYAVRGQRVMLDVDLARLYGVTTKALLQAIKRNLDRFPAKFMFHLNIQEVTNLRSQIVTSSGHGGRRYAPYAFTELGVAMLSSVLRSKRAVRVNIEIVRTFVRLRRILSEHQALAIKLAELERKYDDQFKLIFEAIRELMRPPEPKSTRPIGFASWGDQD